MRDTRRASRRFFEVVEVRDTRAPALFSACLVVAALAAFLPAYPGLDAAPRWTLFILILAAGLWMTEAIPAFAVALLVIGLEIAILGKPGGVFAGPDDAGLWEAFTAPWASSLIWLFLGGFIMASAASKTGLDRAMATAVLRAAGPRPEGILAGAMGITFVLSMFVSNTATAAMMLAVMGPILAGLPAGARFDKGLLLGIAMAANLGGMGTLIGTPPNAIAAGILSAICPVEFSEWMLAGIPPALVLLLAAWWFLMRRYGRNAGRIVLDLSSVDDSRAPRWQQWLVVAVFAVTVSLWIGGSLHHSNPSSVIAFIPITLLSVTGVIGVKEIRELRWDVLLMLTGGLSLGVAVIDTGLAEWIVGGIDLSGWGGISVGLMFAFIAMALSNFMSNTAAANILVPIGMATALGLGEAGAPFVVVIGIALSASAAMCLPIATPPNAIAYSSGRLRSQEFILPGLVLGVLAPLLSVGWLALLRTILAI